MRSSLLFRIFFIFIFLFGIQIQAAPWAPKNKSNFVKAELISSMAEATPGSTIEVGLKLTHDPHWHTYWKATGDSGLPTEIQWTLPDGWKAGDIQWPIPKVFKLGTLINYGYDGEVLLPVQITIPPDQPLNSSASLKAEVSWLMCAEQCVPGRASLSLDIKVGPKAVPSDAYDNFQETLKNVPSDSIPVTAKIDHKKKLIELSFPDKGALENVYIFAQTADSISYGAPQEIVPTANGFSVFLHATEFINTGDTFEGLILVNDGQVSQGGWAKNFSAPLKEASLTIPVKSEQLNLSQGSLLISAFFAFIGGLILNLMPCVFPVLSLKIIGIVENRGTKNLLPHGFGFLAGILLTMLVLSSLLIAVKSTGAMIGWGFQLQSPFFVCALATLFIVLSANLLGFFEFSFTPRISGAGTTKKRSPFLESFLTGVLAVFVASPCTAPFMGAALGYALSASYIETLFIFLALGLGMALPWFLLTVFPWLTRWLPKPGQWMITFKKWMALPMGLTALWLLWVLSQQISILAFACICTGLLLCCAALYFYGKFQFGKLSAKPVAAVLAAATLFLVGGGLTLSAISPVQETYQGADSWSPQKVNDALKQGKRVFVDFTASWCLTCQANKLAVLRTSEVQKAFKDNDFVVLEADWTNYDERITKVLEHFGRSGVPLYVVYEPDGSTEILPELLTQEIVLKAIKKNTN